MDGCHDPSKAYRALTHELFRRLDRLDGGAEPAT